MLRIVPTHHRVAGTVVPGRVSDSESIDIATVGGRPPIEGVGGVVMPVVGLDPLLFFIPLVVMGSVSPIDIFFLYMVNCPLPPVNKIRTQNPVQRVIVTIALSKLKQMTES